MWENKNILQLPNKNIGGNYYYFYFILEVNAFQD